MKIACTIEARMESSRLPGKVLKKVMGKPLLQLMIERLNRVPSLDEIVIATTVNESCDPIQELADELGISCFRGSEDDVLGRVLGAAESVGADLIVETTGDCPLIDPEVIEKVIQAFLEKDVDYAANVLKPGWPRGMDVQVFPVGVLEEVARLTNDPHDREHVSIYIYSNPDRYRLYHLAANYPELRLTVDTPEDFRVVENVFERLLAEKSDFGLGDILALAEKEPQLFAANTEVSQKETRIDTGR